jgi:catechol 2,3-dioxygenase-like lactoylglutathione lyase family enzyme
MVPAESPSSREFAPATGSDATAVVSTIHHVQITIPRGLEAEAQRFYCQFLGLPEVRKPESLAGRGGLWCQAGDLQLHIGVEDGVDRSATKSHIAYAVCGLDAWRSKLAAAGIEILDGIPIPGYARFEFRDPFGNRVEFIERTESQPP